MLAARLLGMELVPCIELAHLSAAQRRAYILADNKLALNAGWDAALLRIELADLDELGFDIGLVGFAPDELQFLAPGAANDGGQAAGGQNNGSLAARFGVPPFTVLNAREGYWQDRKRAWLALGIQSELGRGEGATWGDRVDEPGLNYYRDREANAAPGGSLMPAARLEGGKTVRGDGRGRKANTNPGGGGGGGGYIRGGRKANAIPGGAAMPVDRARG